jgi:uncharacterized iron-regulated membrane protein
MQGKLNKRFWYALHGWLALPIWGLLALICITGTLCTVTQEITWLLEPEVRAVNPAGAPAPLWNTLADSVRESYPEAELTSVRLEETYLAALVHVQFPEGGSKRLLVNQYTGEVQGESQGIGLRGFMLALHGWLMFPWQDDYSVGWYIVTAASFPLLGSLITGIIIFKRFWRVFYRPRLRWGKGRRVFWGDLHRLLAAWSIPFIAIISASGLLFLVEGALYQNDLVVYPETPQLSRDSVPVTVNGLPPQRVSLGEAAVQARSIYPDLQITRIALPEHAYEPLTVRGTRGFSVLRDTAYAVHVNPYSGEVASSRGSGDLTPLQALSAVLMPLHFGDFAGLVSKLIWFFFGCLLSVVVCSGFIVWSKRSWLESAKLRAKKQETLPPTLLPGKATASALDIPVQGRD